MSIPSTNPVALTFDGNSAEYNINLDQGASWSKTLFLKKADGFPKDLTGYTAKAQIRYRVEDEDIVAEITTLFVPPRKNGELILSLTHEETSEFEFFSAVWDLFITSPDGTKSKLLKGCVLNNLAVTREQTT
jgi:hypothetical protein